IGIDNVSFSQSPSAAAPALSLWMVDSGLVDNSCTLWRVDPSSAASLRVGETGYPYVVDIAGEPSGLLDGITWDGKLLSINTQTGAAAPIGNGIGSNQNESADSLAFDPAGALYAATSGGNFYSVDPSTGSGTYIG